MAQTVEYFGKLKNLLKHHNTARELKMKKMLEAVVAVDV